MISKTLIQLNGISPNAIIPDVIQFFWLTRKKPPGELGFICPSCSTKTTTSHVVQCSSCKTILNFVRAAPHEEKVVFNVPKCSHCVGSVEDEWEIEPLYQSDSYI